MTPERLAHLLRRDPVGVLERFPMFVIDEAHLLAQPGRGFLLESLLAVLSTTNARVVMLSGVRGNAQQVATWLDEGGTDALFSSAWRRPRRLHALLYSQVVWSTEQRFPGRSKAFDYRAHYPMIADLRVRPAEGKIHRLGTSPDSPIGDMWRSFRKDGTYKQERTRSTGYALERPMRCCPLAVSS